jgi:serine/threonine-protein kinase
MADRPPDEAFAQQLLKMGVVTQPQVRAALQLQAERALKGETVPLGEILVKQGILTPAMREGLEKKLGAQREESRHLGPYRILRKLGEGGMGVVYLAEDTATGNKVALKVLPKIAAREEEAVRRFLREVDSARKLDHPNIVRAGAASEDKGFHYYVMEYVEGETLGGRLKREDFLSPDEAAKVVLQVAHGLKYAHEEGFIHRDIKPDNVILSKEGVVKILDMGLSKNIDDAQTFRTVTGVALGTPHYIAPEQARGDKGIDGRADIYSLGATYYHLVTGETPFHGTTAIEIIAQHLNKQLPDPRDIRDGIPDGVVHVIRRMMAKKPKDRYKDCSELLTDLELVVGGHNPSSQALDAAHSAVGLPMQREARERYRQERLRARKGTVRPTTRSKSVSAPLVVGAVVAAILIAIVLAVASSGDGSKPVEPPAVVAKKPRPEIPKPREPEPSPRAKTREELRLEEAARKLGEIEVAKNSGGFGDDEIRRRYAEFARAYPDTPHGQTIESWLRSKEPKPETPKTDDVPPPPPPIVPPKPEDPAPTLKPPDPAPPVTAPPEASAMAASLRRGLVGWWKLNEGAGTRVTDSSGNGNHGAIQESATWDEGKIGKALNFNGKDACATVPNSASLQITGDLTIAFWMRKNSDAGDFSRLVGKGSDKPRNYGVWLEAGGGKRILFQQWDASARELLSMYSKSQLEVGTWYHVAAVVNGNTASVYINGQIDASGTRAAGTPGVSNDPLTFAFGIMHSHFSGLLNDIRIYNRTLSEDEIRQLGETSSAAKPAKPSGKPSPLEPAMGPEGSRSRIARTGIVGGIGGIPFEESPPEGAGDARLARVLVGLRYSLGDGSIVKSLQPIYLSRNIRSEGMTRGLPSGPTLEVMARPGYAVAGVIARGGNRVHAIKVIFRRAGIGLRAAQPTYASEWLGGASGGEEVKLGDDGRWVIGIHGRMGNDLDALGLILATGEPALGPAEAPDATLQHDAEAAVRKAFPIDRAKTAKDKAELARTLLQTAAKSGAKETELYVLLRIAKDLAAQGMDAKTALEAIDARAAAFDVDAMGEKVDLLTKTTAKGQDAAAWAGAALDVAQEASEADDYESAVKLAARAEALARLANDRQLQDLAKDRSKELADLKRVADGLTGHFKTLETKPDDPAANTAVGKFVSLVKGDWKRGLPMLAKGSDVILKQIAAKEIARPKEPEMQFALAEDWDGLSEKARTPLEKRRCQVRAKYWYQQALADATGVLKPRIEKRLKELSAIADPRGGIDLLALIDPAKDAVRGTWKSKGTSLLVPGGRIDLLQIPYSPPEEYDVRIVASSGTGDVGLIFGLAVGERQVTAVVSWNSANEGSGHLKAVDGRDECANLVKGIKLKESAQRTTVYSIRKAGIRATVDGVTIVNWNGDFGRLSLPGAWMVPNKEALFIATWDSSYLISEITLFPITGSGKKLR